MSDEKVCVVGATGYLGISVVEELCRRRRRRRMNKNSNIKEVVAVVRNASSPRVSRLCELGVTIVFVDASSSHEDGENGNSYDRLFRQEALETTTAISCLAARTTKMATSTEEGEDDWTVVDRDANIRFGRAALRAGVKHLLLVSTFEGRASRSVSEFCAAKEDAVDVLRHVCHTAHPTTMELTVVRPNAYFKDLTNRAFDDVLIHGRHTVLGHGTHLINPIAREDVATFIADCVQGNQQQHERGRDYLMGGPDVFTFREIGMLAAKVIHRHNNNLSSSSDITIREIPLWKLRLMATLLQALNHSLAFIGCCRRYGRGAQRRAAMLHWMIHVSTHDAVAPCYGSRRLEEEYERKCQLQLDLKQSND